MNLYPLSKPLPSIFIETAFYTKLKEIIEKLLRKYSGMKFDLFRSSDRSSSSEESATVNSAHSSQRQAILTNLSFVLRLVDAMCLQWPSWVEGFGSVFTKLGHKMVTDHIEVAFQNLRSGVVAMAGSLQEHGQSIETSNVQPTPHMALISESMRGHPLWTGSSSSSSAGGPPPYTVSLPDCDEATTALIITVNIMCRGISALLLQDQKEAVLNIMLLILENSDCMLLLGLIVDYFDKWVGRPYSPLTLKQQCDVVSKVDNLDRLSEVLTQVLISRLVAMSERVAAVAEMTFSPTSPAASASASISANAKVNTLSIVPRAVDVFGLMSSHSALRRCCTERAVKVWGSTVFDRLIGFFRADLRLHVNRFWPALFPSMLADCSDLIGCSVLRDRVGILTNDAGVAVKVPPDHPYRAFLDFSFSGTFSEKTFSNDMIEHIGVLSLVNVDACDIWKSILQILWSGLNIGRRAMLSNAMCENVAKHQHRQNLYWPSKIYGATSAFVSSRNSCVKMVPVHTPANVPQSLLRSFLSLEPRPLIPIEFLGALGTHCRTWSDSCEVLESILFSEAPSALVKQRAIRTLLSLYNDLDDQDSSRVISALSSERISTRIALSLENYGYEELSQRVLWKALREYNYLKGQDKNVAPTDVLSSMELETWETRWVESAKNLSQWDLLYPYSEKLNISHVAIECAAMRDDYASVRRLRSAPSVVANLEMGIPKFKLFDVMQYILEKAYTEADHLCALTVQMALFRWQLLPPITSGCNSHNALIHLFHRIIELKESTSMIKEVQSTSTDHNGPGDLKGMIETWRERLPDPKDSMYVWDTLLTWRTHVFQQIQSAAISVQDDSQLAAIHDAPWTVIKLAHVANKKGLPDKCLLTLSKLDSVKAMDISDCYGQLREQILVCLKSESQWNAGLNIINTTNLEYFNEMQKSELFRLKAVFQEHLGLVTESYASFSQSVQLCSSNGKAWYSWGEFCYDLFQQVKCTENAVSALVPIVKAVECNFDKAKPLLSRVIYLLATEDDILTIGNAFQISISSLPEWVWIPFIPQLLDATKRHEGNFIKPLLCKLAEKYPQAIFNHLSYYETEPNTSCTGSELNAAGTSGELQRMRSVISGDVLKIIARTHRWYSQKMAVISKGVTNSLTNFKIDNIYSILINAFTSHVDDTSMTWGASELPSPQLLVSFVKKIKSAFADNPKMFDQEIRPIGFQLMREKIRSMEDSIKVAFKWALDASVDELHMSIRSNEDIPNCSRFADLLVHWIRMLEVFLFKYQNKFSLSDLSP